MKIILFLLSYMTVVVLCDLDAALVEFNKKRSDIVFPKNEVIDRTKSKSNMRKSTEFAQKLHDTFVFAKEFLDKDQRLAKRQVPLNPGSPGSVISPANCPFNKIKVTCNPQSKYRTYDGTCNNLNRPLDGAANTPYSRFLPPAYGDKIDSPRTLGLFIKNILT